ncbi:MAG: thioredoxin [Parvularculaceae bacterium]|nr:thioredoxin [Parvularculaceae bacterium]
MTIIGAGQPQADLIKDATIETFEKDVLEASMTTPVLVDFWAEWCGPCKQLGPMLEKAVNAANGAVRLVKIDIDKNQMLASQMRIQSVPTVYAFFQGRPVDGFQGALPESQIKAFIEQVTRMSGEGLGGDAPDLSATLDAADDAAAQGQAAQASELYAAVAQAAGDDEAIFLRALAGLAKCRMATGDAEGARAVIESAPEDKRNDPAFASVLAALELAAGAGAGGGDVAALKTAAAASPNDPQARFDLAEALAGSGDMEGAIDELLASITAEREWNESAARLKLLQVFEALGPAHPLALRGRRRLSSVLFS